MLPLISILGPTACGKTDLAIALSHHFPIEIVSVDSAMVYRGMDIGTGKPSADMLKKIPHHLIDICDPKESYSAGRFLDDIQFLYQDITARQRMPLLTGGTMMYFRVLLQGLAPLPPAQPAVRALLQVRLKNEGLEALYQELCIADPVYAEKIAKNDSQRILRGLELITVTQKKMNALWENTEALFKDVPHLIILIEPRERTHLHERIENRFIKMMQEGLLYEVEMLFNRGDLLPDLPSIRSVGYRQLWAHFSEGKPVDQCVYEAICRTRQLAKRQLTWMRSLKTDKRVCVVSMEVNLLETIGNHITEFLARVLAPGV